MAKTHKSADASPRGAEPVSLYVRQIAVANGADRRHTRF